MANSITSSEVTHFTPFLIQKVRASIDTSGSAVSQALAFTSGPAPDLVSYSTFTQGTDVIQVGVSFDTTNWEVDIIGTVENGGTIGTHVVDVYLFWFEQARQDGQSINSDNNS